MNCEEARQNLLDSLDGQALDQHIASCEACRRFAEVQRRLDARFAAALPIASLSPGFRSSLRRKLNDHEASGWPEFLPDVAHVTGCALAIALLFVAMPQYSRTVLLAGSGFTAVSYFVQAVLRRSLEAPEDV